MSGVRVRFAPSPTGELHIGGARTALFNYLFVRKTGGTLVLRIDDTDLERSRSDYIGKLLDALRWLNLDWDEGPYYQSKRLEVYTEEAERLLDEKKAYRCYCSVEDLAAGREAARRENKPFLYPGNCRNLSSEKEESFQKEGRVPVLRLFIPDEGTTVVRDLIRGEVTFENALLDDFIIMKSNGLPTYNYASVVDDLKLNITHVIRAEEHLSNTPRQQICATALGYNLPHYAHVPMILAPDRSKLSKRHGATSVEEFYSDGYLPEALLNYLALLGWSPGDDEEILPLDTIISRFTLERVNKTAAIYDVNKLTWINCHYMREYDPGKLAEKALPFFQQKNLVNLPLSDLDYEYFIQVIDTARERARTMVELAEVSDYFFSEQFAYDEKGVQKHFFKKKDTPDLLRRAAGKLQELEYFNQVEVEEAYRSLSEELEVSTGRLIHPTRLALTGKTVGPGIFEIMTLLGREKTVERMKKAASYIETQLTGS